MNHVMTAVQDLRTTQLHETRGRIARAVLEVLGRDGAAHLSFPSVAEQAGVSLRTVYRHFPNKEALLAAGLEHGSKEASLAMTDGTRLVSNVREFLPALWIELSRNRDAVHAMHATPEGMALRVDRVRARVDEARTALAQERPDLTPDQREGVALIATVLMSSHVLMDLLDLGLDVDDAADLVARSIEAIAANPEGAR